MYSFLCHVQLPRFPILEATTVQGRAVATIGARGSIAPPPPIGIPPTKLLENQNFPWEMTMFYSDSVELSKI